jgi:catecholate siderophore receptor
MNLAKAPSLLRLEAVIDPVDQTAASSSGKKVSAVAGLIAVASLSARNAQQSGLLPR